MSWFECRKCMEKDAKIKALEYDSDYYRNQWKKIDNEKQYNADFQLKIELNSCRHENDKYLYEIKQCRQEIEILKRELETVKSCNVELRLAMEALGKYR